MVSLKELSLIFVEVIKVIDGIKAYEQKKSEKTDGFKSKISLEQYF